jgi:hypothetical protein
MPYAHRPPGDAGGPLIAGKKGTMKITFEIRIDVEGQSWALRVDGHEWETGLTTVELERSITLHARATMDCLVAEVVAD